MMNIRNILTEDRVCQYCLDLGRGIVYPPVYADDSVGDVSDRLLTTENETKKAEKAGINARYVRRDVVEFYMYHSRPAQIAEAITNSYDSCELDEWQAVQDVFRVELSYENAKKITDLLWEEEESTSPRDFVDDFMSVETAKAALNKVKLETKLKILTIFAEIGIDYLKYIENNTANIKGEQT